MYNSKEYEEFIKNELYNEADKISPSEDILCKVRAEMGKMENVQKPSLKEIILNKTLPFQLNLKRCFSLALCTVFVFAGLTLTFSKDARVAAADGINKLGRWMYIIDRTDKGYTPVKVQLDDSGKSDTTFGHTDMTDQELRKEAGFFVKIPSELWGGYKFSTKVRCIKNSDSSTELVGAEYTRHNELLSVSIQDKKFLEQLNDKRVSEIVNKKVFKIGDHEVYWIEESIKGIYPEHDRQKMPEGVKIYHSLLWEYNGSCYRLRSNEQKEDISLNDALKIAEAIVNDVYPPADSIQEEKETDTYLSVEASIAEIEKKLGYSAKIPKVLPGNFELIMQEVANDSVTNDSKMYQGLYAGESKTLYGGKLWLVITKSDWPVTEHDRIKEPADDTRAFEIDGHEFLWRWDKDSSHQLGWNDDGVYYCIRMDCGDFSSMDEALQMAKAILNYKNK